MKIVKFEDQYRDLPEDRNYINTYKELKEIDLTDIIRRLK